MLTLKQLAECIGAELIGSGDIEITSVGPIETASENEVTFITVKKSKHMQKLKESAAGAVIVSEKLEDLNKPQLIVENVDAALIKTLTVFAPELELAKSGIDHSAHVSKKAKIAPSASIGACAVIESGVEVGENCVIASGCRIGQNSKIGRNTRLDGNVVVYHNCSIGENVIIQANAVIGATGFGYSFIDGSHRLVPHNGGVVIEDFVEIGANCCVDRAKFNNTVIGAGTKIDNLVQIGHNVIIGKCCLIVSQVGVSGSTKIGNGVVLAGQVGVIDNIEIGDGVVVGAKSGVINNLKAGQKVVGAPAIKVTEQMKRLVLFKRLPKMLEQLRQLTIKVEKLEAAKDDKR